jgi:membrane-anchored mycosin MYCP
VTTGTGVTVAVIDSGLNPTNPQLRQARILPGIDATSAQRSTDVFDCVGHGSEVTAVIAAQPSRSSPFLGVAPGVRILPIRQTTQAQQQAHGSSILARAIEDAIHAGAQVANVSLGASASSPALLGAVRDAARAGLIIVAAAGNKGENGNTPQYPAAYSTRFPNVIAVAASDQNDGVPEFPNSGNYVDIAAPGKDIVVPAPRFGFTSQSGTSFAAPYVTGTVALLLAAHPHLTPAQVRARLEATADQPGVTVPNPRYGAGILDPYLAVASVSQDIASSPSASPRAALPAPTAPPPPSRHLQHLALAVGVTLVGIALLVLVAALVARSSRATRRPRRAPSVR